MDVGVCGDVGVDVDVDGDVDVFGARAHHAIIFVSIPTTRSSRLMPRS